MNSELTGDPAFGKLVSPTGHLGKPLPSGSCEEGPCHIAVDVYP